MRKWFRDLETPGTVVIFLVYMVLFLIGYGAMYVYLNGLWNLS